MADDVVNLADRRKPEPAPPPVMLDDCLCKTYGELFEDLANEIEGGRVDNVLWRLRKLAKDYASEAMPDLCGDGDD